MELWPLLVPSTCESCTGARRRLRPPGRLGRPGVGCTRRGAGRGCGGRGRARACQRVPSFIYDVKSMSLSAGLLGDGCAWGLDSGAGLHLALPAHSLSYPSFSQVYLGDPTLGLCLLPVSLNLCHPLSQSLFLFLHFHMIKQLLKLLVFVRCVCLRATAHT